MTNLSDDTRKQQILTYLTLRKDEWVDGPEIANERIGGSEGLRRLRELRADGYIIQQRRHPEPERAVWQYRLTDPAERPLKPDADSWVAQVEPLPDSPPSERPDLKGMVFGFHVICPTCKARRRKCDHCGGKGYIDRPPGT
jgi:hypothetical protein